MSGGVIAAHEVIGGGGGGTYPSAVLADAPLFYGRLGDAGAGTTMADSSGNGHNGTYSTTGMQTTGLVTGDTDGAINIVGSNRGTIANAAWMNVSAFTVEALIKPTAVTGAHAVITRDGNAGSRGWNLYVYNSHLMADDGNAIVATGATTLVANTKYHVVETYDGTTVRLYLNGVLDATVTHSLPVTLSNPIIIGQSAAGTSGWANAFAGTIDEAAYYGSALSGTRIAAHAALI